ncbi:hypothetical protein MBLNU457_g0568t1 [Dothideomycetes sp. NU457]
MYALHFAVVLPLLVSASVWTPDSTVGSDRLAAQGLVNLAKYEFQHHPANTTCSLQTAYVRREWHTLSKSERSKYIDAVLCLQQKPSISGSLVPGARSRYDDFVGTHINQTLSIHGTGNFLSWHRYFTWTYEQALRNECGYTGHQPYLNWAKIASNPIAAPVFDGSSTSMSNNGAYYNHSAVLIPSAATPFIVLPPGTGGGCVTKGPFSNMTVRLGPVAPAVDYITPNPSPDGLGFNPRCLRRDISTIATSTSTTDRNVTDLINQNDNVLDFQNTMQGNFPAGLLGVHTAGHMIAAGDPGGDLFTSPGDPYFFLHHAQIDRVWWIWQNQDLEHRQYQLGGTLTLYNSPPSRNTSLSDLIDLGVNAPGIPINDMMSTLGGPLCYIYI